MASIQKLKKGWRVQVCKCGVRRSKVFASRFDAETWGKAIEEKLKKESSRLSMREKLDITRTMLVTSIPSRVLSALGQIPHQLDEVLGAAVPYRKGSGIYFLIKDNEVVYIGQSVDVFHRMSRHRREAKDFDSFAYIECEKEKLDQLEAAYITAFIPTLNLSLGRVPKGVSIYENC